MNPNLNGKRSFSMSRKKKKVFLIISAVCFLTLLVYLIFIEEFSPINGSLRQTQSYHDAKSKFAEMLSNSISTNQTKYRIAVIKGAIYEPGYVLDPDNPADLVTEACKFSRDLLVESDWAPLPVFESENSVATDLESAEKLMKYSNIIDSLGGKIKRNAAGIYLLKDIKQLIAPRVKFYRALANPKCQNDIKKNQGGIVVRGHILAKEYFSTSNEISTEAKTTLTGAWSVVVKVDHKGHFSLEDREPIPRFHVLTAISGGGPTRGSIEDMLEAPTDEQIEKLGGIVFDN